VPEELRALVGKRKEKRTLGTKDPVEAKRLHAAALAELEDRWAGLRSGPRTLSEREAHELAAPAAYERWLATHRENPSEQTAWRTDLADHMWASAPIDVSALTDLRFTPDPAAARLREPEAWCLGGADDILAARGLVVDDASRLKLAKAIAAVIQRASLVLARWGRGGVEEQPLAAPVLAEQIDAMAELRAARSRPMVVAGDPFDGILRTAGSIKADLIVMGAHRKQLLRDIFVGTTVERVIRTGPYPVLMVNNEARQPYRNALAAVDMSEPSARAIKAAWSAGLVGDGGITLVHAFFPLGKGKMSMAGIDQAAIDEYVATERRRALDELVAFLAANGLDCPTSPPRVEEGEPFEVISRVVEELRTDLLVLGTHGRSGLAKVLLGSVTEEALRRLDVDVLAVPPVRSPPEAATA
jgi:universal stress protein E